MLLSVQNGSIWVQNNTKYENAKIVENNLGKTIWYSNTLEYFGRIYSFAKIFVEWANLFWYSFVIFLSCRIYSDIHSSNIYGNKYIGIFICPKIWYSSHTVTGDSGQVTNEIYIFFFFLNKTSFIDNRSSTD